MWQYADKMAGLIVLVGLIVWLVLPKVTDKPAEQPAALPLPTVTATEDFMGFPWGVSKEELQKLITEKKLEPTTRGFLEMRGPGLYYLLPFGECQFRAVFRTHDSEKLNFSAFYQGEIYISQRSCPVEPLFKQISGALVAAYGETPELGYPPRRNSGTEPPWGPGSGRIWQVKSPKGQLIEIQLELRLKDEPFLRLTHVNLSQERRYKNLVNPQPEGDPTQAKTNLEGFMGVEWGANPEQVKRGMKEAGFAEMTESSSPNNFSRNIKYAQGVFLNLPVASATAYMKHDTLYWVNVQIEGDAKDGGEAKYQEVRAKLIKEYGDPMQKGSYDNKPAFVWQFPLKGFVPNEITIHRSGLSIFINFKCPALESKLNNL